MQAIGNFALARRDIDSGEEQIRVVTPLPVERQRLDWLAEAYEATELRNDPASPVRWFVVRLSDEEVSALGTSASSR